MDLWGQILKDFWLKWKKSHTLKWIWICRLPSGGRFVSAQWGTSTPIHARAWKEKALAGYNSQQIPTENDIHKMLIIIILLRWKHFVIKSYLYKITTNTLIFSQLNFTHRWLSIVFHIEFEELHKADKSIVEHCGICINLSVFISE